MALDPNHPDDCFHVQLNDGPEYVFSTLSGVYYLAVGYALAMFPWEFPEDGQSPVMVKIWVPTLVKAGYGPYLYGYDGNQIFSAGKAY